MKKIIMTAAVIMFAITAFAQKKDITLCHTPSTEKFAMFASSKEFNKSHLNPREFDFVTTEGGKMIKYKTADGADANAFFIEAKQKSDNWIFVFQEWWGLNDNIKETSEKLYKDLGNVNVLAIDMYDGKLATD